MLAGYTTFEEFARILQAGFEQHNNTIGLRNTASFALAHALLLRGDNTRNIDFSCMFTVKLSGESFNEEKIVRALVVTLLKSKTNDEGRKDFSAVMRHLEVECCAIAWLALYLMAKWDVDEDPFPDFSESKKWFNLKVKLFELLFISVLSLHN